MLKTHAVGIDLGTTYSCIAYLNEHGEPVTLANQEGELSTPVPTQGAASLAVRPSRLSGHSRGPPDIR